MCAGIVSSCWTAFFMGLITAGVLTGAINDRPIIGILTEHVYGTNESYIASSYVKFLEGAGARVVPIRSNSSQEELTNLFDSINGVLFPGGGLYLNSSSYGKAGRILYDLAKKANDGGDYFPLWGTCLGFELLIFLEAGGPLASMDASNIPLSVKWIQDPHLSKMFSSFSAESLDWMSKENITFNHHKHGVTLSGFESTSRLNEFYTALSTSRDRNGIEFVSNMEAKKYPFYGVQWHPEKSGYEWNTKETINHSQHAVTIMQMAANFFVSEARRSNHHFASLEEEESNLIFMYRLTYTGDKTSFEQKYYFYINDDRF